MLDIALVEDLDALDREGVPTGSPVPGRHRAAVRGLPQRDLEHAELPLVRRSQHTFGSGPPPVLDTGLDPEAQGPAAVALALVAAIEAHPSASAPQAAAIAGALIANAGTGDDEPSDPQAAAEAFVRLQHALGSEAYVVSADDDVVELAVSKSPFAAAEGLAASLCHVSSGLAGQLAAKIHGAATVLLDEAIVAGDPECHLQVLLRAGEEEAQGQPYFWPARAAAPSERVPHLDLSVALPRESVSVPVVRRLAAQALRAFGVHDEDVDDVQLAITEACANVIDHAGATDTYDVKIELSADRCAITVVDQGGGFDAASVPHQADDDAEMGRGLTLMRALVDNVAFRNEPQAGAVVHMVKTLNYDAEHPLRRG
jgi:serine/threonine-protein kinase RsbW